MAKSSFRAQGTIEYLLIIVVVIVVALVVVGLLVSMTGPSSGVSLNASKTFWKSQALGLSDAGVDGSGNSFFVVTNNTGEMITLTGYRVGSTVKDFDPNGTLPTIAPGEKKVVFVAKQTPCTGSTCSLNDFSFTYTNSNGLLKSSNKNDLVLEKQGLLNRLNFAGSALVCVNNDSVGVCSGGSGSDTNTQTIGWTDSNGIYVIDINASNLIDRNLTLGRIPFATTGGKLIDDGNLFWDNINDYLGIGTTTPKNKLNVVGDINATTNIYGGQVYDSGLTTGRIVFPTTGGLLTGDGNLFWDNTNKRLGIGKIPAQPLDVLFTTTSGIGTSISAVYGYVNDNTGQTITSGSMVTPARTGGLFYSDTNISLSGIDTLSSSSTTGLFGQTFNRTVFSGTTVPSLGVYASTTGSSASASDITTNSISSNVTHTLTGMLNAATDSHTHNAAGKTSTITIKSTYSAVTLQATQTAGTITQNTYGDYVAINEQASNSASNVTTYGDFITVTSARGSTPMVSNGLWIDALAGKTVRGLVLSQDNNAGAIYLGVGQKSSIYYDGNNLLINPKSVGTGQLQVLGDLNVSGFVNTDKNLYVTGNIGIGTTTPVQKLDINAVMHLVPIDTPGTCSATYTGSLYFDASLARLCYCNGTNWCKVADDTCNTSTSCG